MIRSSLDQIKKSNAASELNFINRGIEKECLRVDALGLSPKQIIHWLWAQP